MDRNEIITSFESNQAKILYLINENPKITQVEMVNKLGLARSTISSNIKKLKENN